MSSPKQKYVWICLAGGELTAAFASEELAIEFCKMQNVAQETLQSTMRQMGFVNYGRKHYSFVKKELARGIDG